MILTQTHTLQAGSIQTFHLYRAQQSFSTKAIYIVCFQKGWLSASSVPHLSTPWEGLGLFYFQREGPRSHCFPPTFSLLSPSATLLQHFLYVHALLQHTHGILHPGGIHRGLLWVPLCSSVSLHEGCSKDAAGMWPSSTFSHWCHLEEPVWQKLSFTHIFWFLKLYYFSLIFFYLKKNYSWRILYMYTMKYEYVHSSPSHESLNTSSSQFHVFLLLLLLLHPPALLFNHTLSLFSYSCMCMGPSNGAWVTY